MVARVVPREVAPIAFSVSLLLAEALILFPFAASKRWGCKIHAARPTRRELLQVVGGGAVFGVASVAFYAGASIATSSFTAALLTRLDVTFALLASPLVNEPVTKRKAAAATTTLAGLTMGALGTGGVGFGPGEALLAFVPLLWTLGNVLTKRCLKSGAVDAWTFLLARALIGAAMLAAVALLAGRNLGEIAEKTSLVVCLASAALYATAHATWSRALVNVDVSSAYLVKSVSPGVTAVLAFLFLGEQLSWFGLLGLLTTVAVATLVFNSADSRLNLTSPLRKVDFGVQSRWATAGRDGEKGFVFWVVVLVKSGEVHLVVCWTAWAPGWTSRGMITTRIVPTWPRHVQPPALPLAGPPPLAERESGRGGEKTWPPFGKYSR